MEDVFVHPTTIANTPKKTVRSVGDGEVVEFNIVVGEKGHEAINVTGPEDAAVKGLPYALDRRGKSGGGEEDEDMMSRGTSPAVLGRGES